ncbi:MAG: class I SAM-dependent methyltransferase [Sphingobacteriaceae bacterium]|nr:class I SAM-dependent methyltransferase [Cytophagaceae bacterium]
MPLKFLARITPPAWVPYLKFIKNPGAFHLLPKDRYRYATDKLATQMSLEFMAEPRFAAAYRWVEKLGGGIVPPGGMQWRIYLLCWAADQVKHLPGDFVACGVFSGFCDRAIIEYVDFAKLGKTYFLMDTFEGLDPRYSTPEEVKNQHRYTEVSGMYEQVQETFRAFPVHIIKGAIPDTLPLADTEQICFLSIDMNTARPEVEALSYFWPKLVPGAVVILDDYGFPGHEAQKHAHDEFARSVGETIFTSPTGQGVLVKK